MATLAEIARQRKIQLKQLLLASRKLDAAQETLEREVKRLVTRKQSIPEVSDAQRLIQLSRAVEAALTNMVNVITTLSGSWAAT
jgi:hypothetical protein